MLSETEQRLQNIIKASGGELLLPQEKAVIKSNLMQFMKQNPAGSAKPVPAIFTWLNFAKTIIARPLFRNVSLAAMALLIGGGGFAFAAQNALPGDLFYPVKTQLTEKVLALTLFSNQAKAEYTINLAQLRLQETETSVAQNKLNSQTSVKVRQLFGNHIVEIQNKITAINTKENARVSVELNSQLEALLEAHAQIIGNLAEKKEGNQAEAIKDILSDVKNKTSQIAKNREQGESRLSLQASENAKINAENKLMQATAAVQELNDLIVGDAGSMFDRLGQKTQTDLVKVNQNVTEGKQKLESGDFISAFIRLQDAVRLTQEINIKLKVEGNLLK